MNKRRKDRGNVDVQEKISKKIGNRFFLSASSCFKIIWRRSGRSRDEKVSWSANLQTRSYESPSQLIKKSDTTRRERIREKETKSKIRIDKLKNVKNEGVVAIYIQNNTKNKLINMPTYRFKSLLNHIFWTRTKPIIIFLSVFKIMMPVLKVINIFSVVLTET